MDDNLKFWSSHQHTPWIKPNKKLVPLSYSSCFGTRCWQTASLTQQWVTDCLTKWVEDTDGPDQGENNCHSSNLTIPVIYYRGTAQPGPFQLVRTRQLQQKWQNVHSKNWNDFYYAFCLLASILVTSCISASYISYGHCAEVSTEFQPILSLLMVGLYWECLNFSTG